MFHHRNAGRTATLCLVVAHHLAGLEAVCAQEPGGDGASPDQKAFCLSSGPREKCVSFLLVEAGVSARLTSSRSDAPPVQPSWEVGAMVNGPGRHAVGAAFFFRGLDADESRAGARLRYRHRMRGDWMFEAGAGVIIESNDTGATDALRGTRILGPSLLARASYRDLVGLSLEYESVDVRGIRREPDLFAVVRAGSKLGGVLVAALAVFGLVGIIIVSAA